jgi:hypothetical protein
MNEWYQSKYYQLNTQINYNTPIRHNIKYIYILLYMTETGSETFQNLYSSRPFLYLYYTYLNKQRNPLNWISTYLIIKTGNFLYPNVLDKVFRY